jgi:mRNA-degrading endonuclease toxin of MazEF toxin-antitoxin module
MRSSNKPLNAGDIIFIDLNPTVGREMKSSDKSGERPVLVITPAAFNNAALTWVVPITQGGNIARVQGFSISLTGTGTQIQGVIDTSQIRSLDVRQRGYRFAEKVPDYITQEVIDRIVNILGNT